MCFIAYISMKLRTDFVTNSSSSSFILARKGNMTEAQKAAVIEIIEKRIFGEKILTPNNTEDEISKIMEENYFDEDSEEKIQKALKEGKSIYNGWISFDSSEDDLGEFFISLWKALEKCDKENFEIIDGDLMY